MLKSNNTGNDAFTMILATTAAGHQLKPAVFILDKTDRALQAWRHLADTVHLNLVDNRWARSGEVGLACGDGYGTVY